MGDLQRGRTTRKITAAGTSTETNMTPFVDRPFLLALCMVLVEEEEASSSSTSGATPDAGGLTGVSGADGLTGVSVSTSVAVVPAVLVAPATVGLAAGNPLFAAVTALTPVAPAPAPAAAAATFCAPSFLTQKPRPTTHSTEKQRMAH